MERMITAFGPPNKGLRADFWGHFWALRNEADLPSARKSEIMPNNSMHATT